MAKAPQQPSRENTLSDATRGSGGKWLPGKSPNPGGRPKGEADIVALAREHSAEAIGKLVEIMRTGRPSEAAAAASAILDRGFGKPRQAIDANIARRDFDEMSDDELIAIARGAGEKDEALH